MPGKNYSILSIPWWIYLLMSAVGCIIITTLIFSHNNAVRMNALYAPLINASVEVELNVTMAHLIVEEILNGDHFEESQVWDNYARANWYVEAMLNGNQKGEETILPMESERLRLIVKDLLKRLSEFQEISRERLRKRAISGPGTEIDQRYNRIFVIFLKEAKAVKKNLQHVMTEDMRQFRVTYFILIVTGVFLALIVAMTLYRLEGLRSKDFKRLQEANENLENEIEERIRAEQKLRDSRETLRDLTNQLQSIREEEKTRIAREVHDELGQMLTGLKMELSCLESDIKNDPDSLHERLEGMKRMVDTTINSVRRIATELRPQILDVCGLWEAIEWQAKDYQKRTGIECVLQQGKAEGSLPKKLSTALFRIFQETLTNVARHAKATRVNISFEIDAKQVQLKIHDNGVGIREERKLNPESLGLLGIQERANYWNGHAVITGVPNKGTTVALSIPLEQNEPTEQH
ncbi:MAG: hypothetical protein CL402_06810 [Acidiferrobacteraceae bacterium]|nr:hypothetical protein [Acidiferrobacteraceae bacterium]